MQGLRWTRIDGNRGGGSKMVRPARDVQEDGVPRRMLVRVAIRAGVAQPMVSASERSRIVCPASAGRRARPPISSI